VARPRKHRWERKHDSYRIRLRLRIKGKDIDRLVSAALDTTERDRELILADAIAEIEKEQELPDDKLPPTTTLIAYSEQWLAARSAKLRPKTAQTYAKQIGRYLLPAPSLNDRRAVDVTRRDVDAWCRWLETQRRADRDELISHEWMMGCWRVGKAMLKDMAADFMIVDPTLRVKAPSGKKKRVRESGTLTVRDASRLIEWARKHPDERRAAEIAFLVSTGVRAGEMYALREHDVDWDRGVATIQRAVSFTTKRLYEGGTKTNIVRDVPLTADLQTILRAHLVGLQDHPSREEHDHEAGPLVFPAPEVPNKFLTWHRRGNSLYKVLARAETDLKLAIRLRPQVFRRTSARLWASIDPKLAKSVHGWVTDEMVDHYGEPAADEKAEAARLIWSRALPSAIQEG